MINCIVSAFLAWWWLGGRIKIVWGRSRIPHFYLDTHGVEVDYTPMLDWNDPSERRPRWDVIGFYDGKWRVRAAGDAARRSKIN